MFGLIRIEGLFYVNIYGNNRGEEFIVFFTHVDITGEYEWGLGADYYDCNKTKQNKIKDYVSKKTFTSIKSIKMAYNYSTVIRYSRHFFILNKKSSETIVMMMVMDQRLSWIKLK